MTMLCSSMQKEDNIEHNEFARLCVYILVCKRKVFLSMLMLSAKC